ncbi:MAG: pirin family protein [Pseudomonadota bacterium]
MMSVRHSEERGRASFGWLNSHHSFSFGSYHDPAHMGFGPLRVINEDRVAPGAGFETHGHQDMEILSYVLTGALRHEDSMGIGSTIRPGDVQRMSAGTGVLHSEFNASESEEVHFLQIWILPNERGLQPSYQQEAFPASDKHNRLRLVGSGDGREGSVSINRDVDLYASLLDAGVSLQHSIALDRRVWLQIVRGEVEANGLCLTTGDGLALADTAQVELIAAAESEILLFDMD